MDHQPIVSPKRALNAFSRILAADLHGTGILINSVDPGWVATDMGGRGGRPVEDGAKGIVWAQHCQTTVQAEALSLMESLLHGR